MTRTDDEQIDIATLQLARKFSHGGPFRFAVPAECVGDGTPDRRETDAGVYLRSWGSSSGGPHPYAVEVPLTPTEARQIADMLDTYNPIRFCCDGPDMGDWPHTYRELVDRFYAALGRRLGEAISASTDRAHNLSIVRAAITGETGEPRWPATADAPPRSRHSNSATTTAPSRSFSATPTGTSSPSQGASSFRLLWET